MADQETFDAAYVKQLREENASWRSKVRELEAQSEVQVELARRGIQADPTWVQMKPGQNVEDAVTDLINKHPQLTKPAETVQETVQRPLVPKAIQSGTGNPINPDKPFHERNVQEIKKDPVARAKLRDLYRAQLAASSNQPDHSY